MTRQLVPEQPNILWAHKSRLSRVLARDAVQDRTTTIDVQVAEVVLRYLRCSATQAANPLHTTLNEQTPWVNVCAARFAARRTRFTRIGQRHAFFVRSQLREGLYIQCNRHS